MDHLDAIRADLEADRRRLLAEVSAEAGHCTPNPHKRPEPAHIGRRRAELLRTENAAFYAARKANK